MGYGFAAEARASVITPRTGSAPTTVEPKKEEHILINRTGVAAECKAGKRLITDPIRSAYP